MDREGEEPNVKEAGDSRVAQLAMART